MEGGVKGMLNSEIREERPEDKWAENSHKVDSNILLAPVMTLHDAAISGNVEIVERLLNGMMEIDAKDKFGQTPLHHAVKTEQINVVKLLINQGACVNACDQDGIMPLHIAGKKNNTNIVAILLSYGAIVNSACSETGWTALHFACAGGNTEVVKLLLTKGAYVDVVSHCNYTPLYLAIKNKCNTIVKLFWEQEASADTDMHRETKSVRYHAAESKFLDMIEDILKFCPNVRNEVNRNALIYAMKDGYRETVEKLLEYGFAVNSTDTDDCTLLHAAVKSGYLKIIEDLLTYGAEVNTKDDRYYQRGDTLLHTAVVCQQLEITQLLINCGADINATNKLGQTPIVFAVRNFNLLITKLLLSNGANVNPVLLIILIRCSDNRNRCGRDQGSELMKILVKYGIEVNSRDEEGKTPICFAAEGGHLVFVKTLLKLGANVNTIDIHGMTPLHFASRQGHKEVVAALLQNGADINITRSLTALDYAVIWSVMGDTKYNNYAETINTLVRHVVIMEAENLFVNKFFLQTTDIMPGLKLCYNICKREIGEMKNKKIGNTKVSFYDFLTKNLHQLAKYIRNENIVEVLESKGYQETFPMYANIIDNQFKRALTLSGRQRF